MRIVLTGVAGFIGSHVGEALLRRGDEVIGLDDFNDYYDPRLKRRNADAVRATGGSRVEIIDGDLRDEAVCASVFARGGFDAVVHLAAWAGVRPSIDRPELYMDVNVRGTTVLLEHARRARIDRFVFASSSSVYGGRTHVPFRETDPVDHPISPYAASKKAGEVICHTWHHLYGMHASCLRFFTVYGPRQRPEMAIHRFATLLSRGAELPFYGDGSTARDYTYIDDVVSGVLGALDHSRGYEIYNLGEERTTRLDELVEKLAARLGVAPKLDRLAVQPGDVPITCADVAKAKRMIGYDPHTSIDDGLARFVEWFAREGVK